MTVGEPSHAPLVGEWTLKSARFEFADGGEAFDMYGPQPNGRLIISAAGRFTVILTPGDADEPGAAQAGGGAPRGMLAYSGAYTVQDDKIVTRVDVATLPGWVGTDQGRRFEATADDLTLFTPTMAHPGFSGRVGGGILRWARAP